MSLKVPNGINMKWPRDIFIDVQIANKFASPPNDFYKKLILELLSEDKTNPQNSLAMVLSDNLINRYISGNKLSDKDTSIGVIVNFLIARKRFNSVGKEECKNFKRKYIDNGKNVNFKGLNTEDKFLFPLIFYSNRKIAIIEDNKFRHLSLNFPPFSKKVISVSCPSLLANL